jgi:NAD-dependent dihydropyrimidine dehydrogenase PreA subunit
MASARLQPSAYYLFEHHLPPDATVFAGYIDPAECIDCSASEPACPEGAI